VNDRDRPRVIAIGRRGQPHAAEADGGRHGR
jgi:hypothetical protein